MKLTRRSALALMGAATGVAAPGTSAIEPVIIQHHDDSVDSALKAQITDPGSRGYGNLPHLDDRGSDLGIYPVGTTGGLLEAFTAAYLHPSSRFHGNKLLIERMKLAAGFLNRAQHEDGLIDYQDTNFDSAPDTAFTVWSVATAACLAQRHAQRELLSLSEPFLRKAAAGLAVGGVHTPNHRWVVSSALAQIHELFPSPAYIRRIDQWLAEGIDIDADGQYTERSTSVYNTICDRSLLVLAIKLNRPALLAPVRQNLQSMLYLVHPDFDVVTEISRRQDRNIRANMGRYWFPLRYLAVKDANGQFATIANHYTDTTASLSTLMEYPEMIGPLPSPAVLPDNYTRKMQELGVVRFRRGPVSSTLLAEDPAFFTTRCGELGVQAIRFASAFFGKGQFSAPRIEETEGRYTMSQQLNAGYYQPLQPPQRVTSANWSQLHKERKETQTCSLQQNVELRLTATGFRIRMRVAGTPNVPVAVEVNLREGGTLSGCEMATPEVALLPKGYARIYSGSSSLRLGPGRCEHQWTQVRGSLPKLPGRSIYLTGLRPSITRSNSTGRRLDSATMATMSEPALIVQILLFVCCLAAAIFDFRSRRIPNWLVLSALILGFGLNIFLYGFGSPGLLGSLAGMGLALLVYMPLYIIRAMGAGDVKLMAAIGVIIGPVNWFVLFLCTAILGGIIALVVILIRGRAKKTLWNVFFMTGQLFRFRAPYLSSKELDVKSGKGTSLPHGVTIFVGAIAFLTVAHYYALR